jgi:hypothetical protein
MKFFRHGLSALALAGTFSLPAYATLVFSTSDSQFDTGNNQGWWSDLNGSNAYDNDNYVVGWNIGLGTGAEYRNFFTFDLSSLNSTVLTARLDVARYAYTSTSNRAQQTYTLFDVSTDASILNYTVGLNAQIFADLGTGTSYGSFDVASYETSATELLSFVLNADAISDINAARGRFFSIGGALTRNTNPGAGNETLMGFSSGAGVQRLVLEIQSPSFDAPAPGSLALLGLGVVLIAVRPSSPQRYRTRN